jgi:hypothetical protein
MDEVFLFLTQRFEANNINPNVEFERKRCLDAGCGSGRVDCIDIRPTNVTATKVNVRAQGADELGSYWDARARSIIRDFGAEVCLKALKLMRLEARYVADYICDWKVFYLTTYSTDMFSNWLEDARFSDTSPLSFGVGYDTSQRRSLFPEDSTWMGQGDLRFLLTKTSRHQRANTCSPLEPENFGEAFSPGIVAGFDALFYAFKQVLRNNILLEITTSANIQRYLRDRLSEAGDLSVEECHRPGEGYRKNIFIIGQG